MDHTPGLSVSFIGRHVPVSVSPAGRLEGRRKNTSYREIGNWVRRGITCYSRSKLPLGRPQRRAPRYQPILTSPGARFIDGDVIEYVLEMTKNVQEGRTKP